MDPSAIPTPIPASTECYYLSSSPWVSGSLASSIPVFSDGGNAGINNNSYLLADSHDLSQYQASSSVDARSGTVCQCPQAIIALLESSEATTSRVEIQNVDTILAHHKEALMRCKNVLECAHCDSPTDHMMLLVVVCRKLVTLVEEVVRVFNRWRTINQLVKDGIGAVRDDGGQHHQDRWNFSFGNYVVDSELEGGSIIKILILVQLKGTLGILNRLKSIAKAEQRETQMAMLQAIEHKVTEIVQEL